MGKFIEQESYLHKMAKDLLVMWLREEEEKAKFDGMPCNFCGITWNKNYGIFSELPFYETSDPYYFECSKGIKYDYEKVQDYSTHYPKDFDKGKILFKPDISIFHQGRVLTLIEIVHSSPLTEKKINTISQFFNTYGVSVYTINAKSILVNTSKPTWLNFQKIL